MDPEDEELPLSEDELKRHQHGLSLLSPDRVAFYYREAYERVKLERNAKTIPSPKAIQYMVTAWRVLWRWRHNGGVHNLGPAPKKPPNLP